jgi:Domain of unknown function (DUF6883)
MRLPNPDRAVVDLRKLSGYCLNPAHSRGRHKSDVFFSALGLTTKHAEFLRDALLRCARTHECAAREPSEFGARYEIQFTLEFQGRRATVCSAWLVRRDENFARLTSCYVVT